MRRPPRLSVGLPVHNGEPYVAQALESVLGQTYGDFELIISDNASTDGTADICRTYASRDTRIRYLRQHRNIGLAANHTFVAHHATGELFKWVAGDDLYAPDLLESCVAALDAKPDAILAHSWTATIDASGGVVEKQEYRLSTSALRAPTRFESLLFDAGGDDIYGVMRMAPLQEILPQRSHHHSDRTLVASLVLHGRFVHVPEWLYMRRDHPERAERAFPTVRERCVNMDRRRASRVRHPLVRLYGEYVWGLFEAVNRAPLSVDDRRACYRHLARWLGNRVVGPPSNPVAKEPAS